MLEVGQSAPPFRLKDAMGVEHALADVFGRWLVLYFYPRDGSPNCTIQACGFRDALPRFGALDAEVWGVSSDDEAAHLDFAHKHQLDFPLLVDPERTMLEAYGVWGERQFMGNRYMGIARTTYLIDPQGKVARLWRRVKVARHADEVAAALEELRG